MNELITAERLNDESMTALDRARAFVIRSDEDYSAVDAHCAGLLELEKKIKTEFKDPKAKAKAAHQAICDMESKLLEPIDEARGIEKNKLSEWRDKKEKARRAEEEALQAAARKQAEDEALKAAAEAEARGDKAEAEAIISTPVQVQTVVVPKSVPKAQTKIRMVTKFRITNEALIPRQYLCPDEKKIGGVARSLGMAANIPGVSVYQEPA